MMFFGSAMGEARTDIYGYNARSELVLAAKNAEDAKEHEYGYDDIGNRQTSSDLGTTRAYTANSLNQYTEISTLRASASPRETFTPQFDDDGNQTLLRTKTGIWSVTYNGENRPIAWSSGSTNIVMKFDRMGRRVSYTETVGVTTNAHRTFTYDNYLQIADNIGNRYLWDPTEPIATRPLAFITSTFNAQPATHFYTHDGNKNVSELVDDSGVVTAHYEYAPFGGVELFSSGSLATTNRFRFSSEYTDDALGLVYYNYRHYDPVTGRWLGRDPIDRYVLNLFCYVNNQSVRFVDRLGLSSLWDWIRDIWNKPKCEKSGGLYANGKCCCNQQYFDPNSYCCLNGITHSKVGEAAAFVFKDYISESLSGGLNRRSMHYWLEWDGNRVEANAFGDMKVAFYQEPPPKTNSANPFLTYTIPPPNETNFDSKQKPYSTVYLSECDGYNVRQFKDCLFKYAKQDHGMYKGTLCHEYIDNLIMTCKQEQRNEMAK